MFPHLFGHPIFQRSLAASRFTAPKSGSGPSQHRLRDRVDEEENARRETKVTQIPGMAGTHELASPIRAQLVDLNRFLPEDYLAALQNPISLEAALSLPLSILS